MAAPGFAPAVVDRIRDGQIIGIRCGSTPHRFIGIWAVVFERRVFVRSWSRSADGWHRVLLDEPFATIQVGGRRLRVRAIQTRSERLKRGVDRAYLAKYRTPGSLRYARDLGRTTSRNTTTELVPAGSGATA